MTVTWSAGFQSERIIKLPTIIAKRSESVVASPCIVVAVTVSLSAAYCLLTLMAWESLPVSMAPAVFWMAVRKAREQCVPLRWAPTQRPYATIARERTGQMKVGCHEIVKQGAKCCLLREDTLLARDRLVQSNTRLRTRHDSRAVGMQSPCRD